MDSKSVNILLLFIFLIFWLYRSYKIWFDTDREYIKAVSRAKWMPRRPQILNNKDTWATFGKVSSIWGTILILVAILLESLSV